MYITYVYLFLLFLCVKKPVSFVDFFLLSLEVTSPGRELGTSWLIVSDDAFPVLMGFDVGQLLRMSVETM